MRWRGLLFVALLAGSRIGAGQSVWRTVPSFPTVGDTVWIESRFPLPAGWRVRPGRVEAGQEVEPLGDPVVVRDGDAWLVRYPITAWTPGAHTLTMPPVWRLGPDAQADSVIGGTVSFGVGSVIPDSVRRPAPRPALDPLRATRRDVLPLVIAVVGSLAALVAWLWWRRRPPRAAPGASRAGTTSEVADVRWIEAGEARAVAARATGRLRAALAARVPEAHVGLSTAECLAATQRARPGIHQELATILSGLDQAAFANRPKIDVVRLADQARALAGALER